MVGGLGKAHKTKGWMEIFSKMFLENSEAAILCLLSSANCFMLATTENSFWCYYNNPFVEKEQIPAGGSRMKSESSEARKLLKVADGERRTCNMRYCAIMRWVWGGPRRSGSEFYIGYSQASPTHYLSWSCRSPNKFAPLIREALIIKTRLASLVNVISAWPDNDAKIFLLS